MEDVFKQYGFILKSDKVVCSKCKFKTKITLCISLIQVIHKHFNPECDMVNYIHIKYHNYSLYIALLQYDDDLLNVKMYVLETQKRIKKTFNTSAPDTCPKWSRHLLQVEKLVSAGFFYTGGEDEVMCMKCKVILLIGKIQTYL